MTTRGNARDGVNHRLHIVPDGVPVVGAQRDERDAAVGQVLLILDVPVGRDERMEAVGLGGGDQLAVRQFAPVAPAVPMHKALYGKSRCRLSYRVALWPTVTIIVDAIKSSMRPILKTPLLVDRVTGHLDLQTEFGSMP